MAETEPTDKEIDSALHSLDPDLISTKLHVDFVRTKCCSCYISFYVPSEWLEVRKTSHENLWCPNGHCLHYPDKSAA